MQNYLAQLANNGKFYVLGMDANQNVANSNEFTHIFPSTEEDVPTTNKERSAMQTQFKKIHVKDMGTKDHIQTNLPSNHKQGHVQAMDGRRVTKNDDGSYTAPALPCASHPFDHLTVVVEL